MSDRPDAPAPSGGEQPNSAPLDYATVVAQLAELDDEQDREAAASPEPSDQPSDEQPETEGEDAAASEPGEGEEASEADAEEPAEDAESDADEQEPEEKLAHGNMRVGLRDGTITTVAELRKLADEAREYRAQIPNLTAAAERAKELERREAQIAQQEQILQTIVPLNVMRFNAQSQPPDPALLASDSMLYFEEKEKHLLAEREFQKENAALIQYLNEKQKENAELLAEENRKAIIEKIPEIADPQRGKEIVESYFREAQKGGFTIEEAQRAASIDYRYVYMLHNVVKERDALMRKAVAYDKIMSQKATAVEKEKKATSPVQQPGRRVPVGETQNRAVNDRVSKWSNNDRSMNGFLQILSTLPNDP
jgi:hypothetical protein